MPITTALPCDYTLFEEIRENGALIDMSKLSFPSIEDSEQKKTALIYLRNTKFYKKSKLVFDDCSYEDKAEFLKLYIESDIDIDNKAFTLTWTKIMNWLIGYNIKIDSILTDDEVKTFVESNVEYLGNILQFLISTPLFVLSTFVVDGKKYELDDSIKTTDLEPVGININNILKIPDLINIFMHDYTLEPLFYKTIFVPENTALFESLNMLPFMSLLVGMKDTDEKTWLSFLNDISEINKLQ